MNFLPRIVVVLIAVFLTACFGQEDPPSTAPVNVTVTEGSGLVVVDWDAVPGRTYWIFYNQGTSASLDDFDRIVSGVFPPYVLPGLLNDAQYAFTVTSSNGASKVGPFSPVQLATPRLLSPSVAWTIGTSLSGNDLQGIAFGNNTYVTVGDAATVFAATYDYPNIGGVTGWGPATTLPVGLTANLNSVVFDGSRFIALGDDGSIITSTDTPALTWSAATAIAGAPAMMNALAVGAGIYVAVGDTGAIYTSSDSATTWVTRVSMTTSNLYGISYVNGNFIAVGASGTLSTSTDGITWATQENLVASSLRAVAYGASSYVAIGDAGAIVSSTDATTWIAQTTNTITESLRAISFGPDNQFVAVGTAGVNTYSSTGLDGSWLSSITNAGSIDLNAIAPNLLYIAVGAAGANVSGK